MLNKLIKNPLFYKEFKFAKWPMLLMIFCFIYKIRKISYMKNYILRENLTNNWFNNLLFKTYANYDNPLCILLTLFLPMIIAIFMLITERIHATSIITESLPFNREKIINMKWIVGVLEISFAYFIGYVLLSLYFLININSISTTYLDIPYWILLNCLLSISTFSISILIQTVIGNAIAGLLLTPLLYFSPMFILSCIYNLVYYKPINKIYEQIENIIILLEYNKLSVTDNITYYFANYFAKILILIIICIACYFISKFLFQKYKIENVGKLFLFDWAYKVFVLLFSICLGLSLSTTCITCYTELNIIIGCVLGIILSKFILKSKLCK